MDRIWLVLRVRVRIAANLTHSQSPALQGQVLHRRPGCFVASADSAPFKTRQSRRPHDHREVLLLRNRAQISARESELSLHRLRPDLRPVGRSTARQGTRGCVLPLPPLHDLLAEFSFASSILLVACSSPFSGVPVPEATPISEAEWLNLLDLPARNPKTSDLAQGLDNVTLEDCSTTAPDPIPLLPDLLAAVDTAFSNLPSLEASFRPSAPPTSTSQKNPRKRVPSWKTLRRLCDVAASRPALVDRLRERIEAILQRPGPTLLDSDGTWLIVLFEVRSTVKHHEGEDMCLTTLCRTQSSRQKQRRIQKSAIDSKHA